MIYKIRVNTEGEKTKFYNLEFTSIVQAIERCKDWFWKDGSVVIISATGSSTALIKENGSAFIREESEGAIINI